MLVIILVVAYCLLALFLVTLCKAKRPSISIQLCHLEDEEQMRTLEQGLT